MHPFFSLKSPLLLYPFRFFDPISEALEVVARGFSSTAGDTTRNRTLLCCESPL
jgi:hypothetical protein